MNYIFYFCLLNKFPTTVYPNLSAEKAETILKQYPTVSKNRRIAFKNIFQQNIYKRKINSKPWEKPRTYFEETFFFPTLPSSASHKSI